MEELCDLENKIQQKIENKKVNLSQNINVVYVYEFKNGKKFKTFKEAFEEL